MNKDNTYQAILSRPVNPIKTQCFSGVYSVFTLFKQATSPVLDEPESALRPSFAPSSFLLRYAAALLLLLVVGVNGVWGQTDYSGTYYIGSVGYDATKTTTNYYLCPTEGWAFFVSDDTNPGTVTGTDNGKPFLTTYQCRNNKYHSGNAGDAVWTIEKAPAPNSDFYYIKQTSTGRYLVSNGAISDNPDRARVHLETISDPNDLDDKALFSIYIPSSKSYFVIKPKGITDGTVSAHKDHDKHKWLVVNTGNKDNLAGTDARTDGPDSFKNTGGIICLYTEADTNAPFYLEIPKPAISQDPSSLNISISDDFAGVTIRYTIDGTEPTSSSTLYEGEFLPEIGTSTVKAKAFNNTSGDVASATTSFNLTKNAAPSISVNMTTKKATISTSVEGGTIYYTTNGNNPTVSSTVYSAPISFNKPTTIKAIVGKVGYAPSTVTTKAIIKVVTPQLYDNGNLAIAITSATVGASIYYTIDGSTPSRSSSLYSAPLTDMDGKTIKAIAVKDECFDSDVATFGPVSFSCAQPVIKRTGADKFTLTCPNPKSGVTIYYTTNDATPTTSDSHVASGEAVTFSASQLPFTVKAMSVADGFNNSSVASLTITNDGLSGSGTSADPYQIALDSDYARFATKVAGGEASACFVLTSDINASGTAEITTPFTGTFDGDGYTISNLEHALFNTVDGGIVKNVMLDAVGISGGTNAGAIANKVTGTSTNKAAIYNCGVLSGSISGSGYVGSIVGQLGDSNNDNCYARVINCFSYATIEGGSSVGGIVGYNDFASASNNLRTMVMNCMFYGKITGGTNKAPIYNGENITNVGTNGLANYNYYYSGCTFTGGIDTYNCALAADERYLTRFEFYRRMLNSNGELAAWYATGSTDNRSEMYKWILLPSSYGTEHPFPVLAPQGIYPSVVNTDADNATTQTERNKGGLLGSISVTVSGPGSGAVFSAPSGASITNGSLTLNITDKDYDHFNYNYRKVQLPYYNEVGTGNCSGDRVVTGWKITSITGGTQGNYSTGDDVTFTDGELTATPYNFADRKCTDKDLYSVSGRVFSQGAYWDVPDGVTAITIEPYWGKAAYLCDQYWNVVYSKDHKTANNVTPMGVHYTNATDYFIEGTWQKVYNSLDNAVTALSSNANHKVYDYAVVLVGNYHLVKQANPIRGNTLPFTVMSADFDYDNEPDYSFILQFSSRQNTAPIRFDFINIPGLGMAQKSYGAQSMPNVGIFKPNGWFEITNTATILLGQFEYDRKDKVLSPLILHGGIIEQIVSNNDGSSPLNKTQYMHLGSNVWFANFSPGIHQDKTTATKHVPVSVTGGEYNEFHLTGTYRADATVNDDNAECYIHGGKFGEITGTGLEGLGTTNGKGNITWVIDHADITNFFGGGINAAKPSLGNIYTEITNSHVTLFCGGPKFGDMQTGKTVTTKATDCTFGNFFGAGYGGNSYNRFSPQNKTDGVNYDWNTWVNDHYTCAYSSAADKNGISTNFDYEFIPMSGGMTTNVARLFVNFLSFSLASTGSVTSTLTGCKVTGNFYGGGSLGKVSGDATSTLTNCTLEQNAYGAGFSATLPTVEVMDTGGFKTEPEYDPDGGVYSLGVFPDTKTYTWQHAVSPGIDKDNRILYTTEDLTTLGTVTGKATLNIEGTTTVGKSVYGGGEESGVDGSTEVNVTGGTIGAEGQGGVEYGNVYGGGKGKRDNIAAGQVKGSTKVTISQAENKTTRIYHNVYGGGAYGSVGDFEYDNTTGMPTGLKEGHAENSGKTYVEITGGTFGWSGKENGMVFGSSRGDVGAPGSIEDQMAWVYDTEVKIGTSGSGGVFTTPTIMGSVYGGGENGHNFHNANVNIYSGTIGIPTGTPIGELSGAYYPYRGNVYGGGCGTDMYYTDPTGVENPYDGNGDAYNPLAGIVRGNATVNISGGYVVHNVYGAGAMGSVGNGGSGGKTTVNISGGRIGYDGNRNGNVFGAARGEYGTSTAASGLANVKETGVNIIYTTTPTGDNTDKTAQLIAGSVFGGGESGTVKGSVAVNMTGGLILKDIYGGGALADTQTSNWDATNNTWAEGKTSASSTTTVRLSGGTIQGEAYGGGLGESGTTEDPDGKPAYVYGNVLVDLNGTTSSGETGTPLDENTRGCAVHDIFGCNNANGTPKGNVLVHIYATQNKTKSQIGNTSGETPVTDAKVKGSYDVLAVYGGGNLAAYEPADAFSTDETTKASATTNVIIDGCGLTSIQQVYGGGNAASTPATKVTVNGTYEIEELFGGGNGKDDIVVNSTTLPNPGANVGFYAYADDATDAQTPEDRATNYGYGSGKASVNVYGGTIHRVFGGSNTKGNVRQTAVTLLDDNSGCDFCVDEAYGGGKSAPMDAEAKLLMACIPGLNAAYGGAEAADIQGNVTLNISNGTFDRVFGGNNLSGTISGSITVNVEEVGCKPVIIGELYGGGNQAGYSVYGYNSDGSLIESGTTPLYSDPQVNVKSFTSIGTIYGGGYGIGAKMVGSPTVNINEVVGTPETYPTTGDDYNATGFKGKTKEIDGHEVVIPAHTRTKIGAINNVFGGGNAAEVKGNTTVNIGTLTEVYLVKNVTVGDAVTDYYTRNNDGTYTAATGTAVEGTTYYEKKTVVGADIRGNVYGGGNNAAVTGNTSVNIGKKND